MRYAIIGIELSAVALLAKFASQFAFVIALVLLVPSVVGLWRQLAWGRTFTKAFSWYLTFVSLAVILPSIDSQPPSPLYEHFGNNLSNTFLYLAVAVSVAPWLICIHYLERNRALFRRVWW